MSLTFILETIIISVRGIFTNIFIRAAKLRECVKKHHAKPIRKPFTNYILFFGQQSMIFPYSTYVKLYMDTQVLYIGQNIRGNLKIFIYDYFTVSGQRHQHSAL